MRNLAKIFLRSLRLCTKLSTQFVRVTENLTPNLSVDRRGVDRKSLEHVGLYDPVLVPTDMDPVHWTLLAQSVLWKRT